MTYSKKVINHFMDPKNVGEIENASGVGIAGNMICGDVMQIFIKIRKNTDKDADANNDKGYAQHIIEYIKFKTMGCAAAIATSSIITEVAKGKTMDDALKITKVDVAEALDVLPPIKMYCSNLASDALAEAIYDYLLKNNFEITEGLKNAHERIKKERTLQNIWGKNRWLSC